MLGPRRRRPGDGRPNSMRPRRLAPPRATLFGKQCPIKRVTRTNWSRATTRETMTVMSRRSAPILHIILAPLGMTIRLRRVRRLMTYAALLAMTLKPASIPMARMWKLRHTATTAATTNTKMKHMIFRTITRTARSTTSIQIPAGGPASFLSQQYSAWRCSALLAHSPIARCLAGRCCRRYRRS